jgi:hypothetical protein
MGLNSYKVSSKDTINEKNITQENVIGEIKLPFNSKQLNYSKRDKNGYYIYDKSFIKNKTGKYLRLLGKYNSNNNVEIVVMELKPKGDEHIDPIVKLYSNFNNQVVDSLTVYENIQWEGTLKKVFEITQDKIIKIFEKSKGTDTNEKGEEIIISSNNSDAYEVSDKGFFVSNKWKGKYYFEARNKDRLKTSFDISILDLNNIVVKYIQDDNTLEVYKNLKGEQISVDKIRIVFNEKYKELGEIYLEKSGNSYFISGQAIYFINPRNDNYQIEKR